MAPGRRALDLERARLRRRESVAYVPLVMHMTKPKLEVGALTNRVGPRPGPPTVTRDASERLSGHGRDSGA